MCNNCLVIYIFQAIENLMLVSNRGSQLDLNLFKFNSEYILSINIKFSIAYLNQIVNIYCH